MNVPNETNQEINANILPEHGATTFEVPARYTELRQVGTGAQGTVW